MYEIYQKLRDERCLKDADVAKGANVAKSTLSDWKAGRTKPGVKNLNKIADFLGVSSEYILTGKEGNTQKVDKSADMNDVLKKYEELKSLLKNGTSHSIRFGGEKKSLSPESINLLIQQLDVSVAFIRESKNSDDKKEV